MRVNKCQNLACNLNDKKKYLALTRTLKQALNHVLVFKKVDNPASIYPVKAMETVEQGVKYFQN